VLKRLLVAVLFVVGCAAPPASKPAESAAPAAKDASMTLISSSFAPGQPIPLRFTSYGDNISPELSWDKAPDGTKSFALICRDPDAPGRTFTHWVVFNIPADVRRLEEGASGSAKLPAGAIEAQGDFGRSGYGGPRPPSGTHHYYFDLYALDSQFGLGREATAGGLQAAMKGHVLAQASVMGTYRK
jgi:Raf kinase inhibitor-like YbhB/YbcL family protein